MREEFEMRSNAQAAGRHDVVAHDREADRHHSAKAGGLSDQTLTPDDHQEGSENTAPAGDRSNTSRKSGRHEIDPEIPAQAGGASSWPSKPEWEKAHPSIPPQGGEPSKSHLMTRVHEAAPSHPSQAGVHSRSTQKPGGFEDAPQTGSDAGGGGDHSLQDIHTRGEAAAKPSRRKVGKIDDDQWESDTHHVTGLVDLRFSDPLIAQIREAHRMRRRWMKARNALILQGKAIARSYVDGGDKKAATDMFNRVAAGKMKPGDEGLIAPLAPFLPAIEGFDEELSRIEKQLEKMAKELPIAAWAKGVRGLGMGSLAAIVGEAGNLSKYPTVAGVWKRMGLAVINGERQRKCADADKAILHGYSPDRRSVVWNMAESVAKLQRTWIDKETGEVKKPADPYGKFLEAEKARILEAGERPIVAEQRAKRHMSKRILRDLTVEWRRIEQWRAADQCMVGNQVPGEGGAPEFREAAE